MYLFASIVGPIFVLVGLAGAFGYGIPGPYWLVSELLGVGLIIFGQRREKPAQDSDGSPVSNAVLTQKRHRFWIFVMLASIIYAVASFFMPVITPEFRSTLIHGIMILTLALCAGIFFYSSRNKQ